MNGGVQSQGVMNGGVQSQRVVNGGVQSQGVMNGGVQSQRGMNGGVQSQGVMNGGVQSQRGMNGGVQSQGVMNGGGPPIPLDEPLIFGQARAGDVEGMFLSLVLLQKFSPHLFDYFPTCNPVDRLRDRMGHTLLMVAAASGQHELVCI
jgi:hypothetical protein